MNVSPITVLNNTDSDKFNKNPPIKTPCMELLINKLIEIF